MISQEQWDAIRQRFMSDYRDYGDDALKQAMQDIQVLLMAAKPYKLETTSSILLYAGTCIACAMGVCKRKESHT
jgi:hypothetical protein